MIHIDSIWSPYLLWTLLAAAQSLHSIWQEWDGVGSSRSSRSSSSGQLRKKRSPLKNPRTWNSTRFRSPTHLWTLEALQYVILWRGLLERCMTEPSSCLNHFLLVWYACVVAAFPGEWADWSSWTTCLEPRFQFCVWRPHTSPEQVAVAQQKSQ